eukprot:jgi/Hompol1/6800/HPOL_001204-RA
MAVMAVILACILNNSVAPLLRSVGFPCAILAQFVLFFGVKWMLPNGYANTRQASWVLTTMSSVVMTGASIPFLIDFFISNADFSQMRLMNSPLAVVFSMFFIAYLFCDLGIGYFHYPDQIDPLTGWFHHLLYPILIIIFVLYQVPGTFLTASLLELPTIVLALGNIHRSFRSEYLFGFLFFVTRIVFHLVFAVRIYMSWPGYPVFLFFGLCTFPLHIVWFWRWVNRQIRIIRKKHSLSQLIVEAGATNPPPPLLEPIAVEDAASADSITTVNADHLPQHNGISIVVEDSVSKPQIAASLPIGISTGVAGATVRSGGNTTASTRPGQVVPTSAASSAVDDEQHPLIQRRPTVTSRDVQQSLASTIDLVPEYPVPDRPRNQRSATSLTDSIHRSLSTSQRSIPFVVAMPTRDGVDPAELDDEDELPPARPPLPPSMRS